MMSSTAGFRGIAFNALAWCGVNAGHACCISVHPQLGDRLECINASETCLERRPADATARLYTDTL